MTAIENLIDTLLNLGVFVFIGVLLWLYLRKEPNGAGPDDTGSGTG